jgi:hypothetical protein
MWEGSAGDGARTGLHELNAWARDAATDAANTTAAMGDQGMHAGHLRSTVPEPYNAEYAVAERFANENPFDEGMQRAFLGAQDEKALRDEDARQKMATYHYDSVRNRDLMDVWTTPPTVVVEARPLPDPPAVQRAAPRSAAAVEPVARSAEARSPAVRPAEPEVVRPAAARRVLVRPAAGRQAPRSEVAGSSVAGSSAVWPPVAGRPARSADAGRSVAVRVTRRCRPDESPRPQDLRLPRATTGPREGREHRRCCRSDRGRRTAGGVPGPLR